MSMQDYMLAIEIHAIDMINISHSNQAYIAKDGKRIYTPPLNNSLHWTVNDIEEYLQYHWGITSLDADEMFYKVYDECVQCFETYYLLDYEYPTNKYEMYALGALPPSKPTTIKVVKEFYYSK